jgi:phage FluMu protein Com
LLICREYIFSGYIELKCPRCGELTTFRFKHNANAIISIGEKPPAKVEAPAINEDNTHG